eukprot:TRINITY_DN106_c0_g1_i1.p1 TRINITY_DN106_c0_g1~~TRINITY_DN106_c0_g1_i1.p1  ORF type:complete len:513 (-),score=148.62 TRINITY_DN106_c0_g1_i1:146-1684(-)
MLSRGVFRNLKVSFSRGPFRGFTNSSRLEGQTIVVGEGKVESQKVSQEWQAGPSVTNQDPNAPLNVEDYAYLGYKKFPTHIPHFDPKNKAYVPSERDEATVRYQVDSHNYLVDRLKSDLKMQRQVHEMLQRLERPYKTEGVPGNTKNFASGVKNYGAPQDIGFQTQDEELNKILEKDISNEDRWISQSIFTPKYKQLKHIEDWEKELENRPVNPNYHPDKGYKFDVATPFRDRLPHVADRLGYPEILGTPWERLTRLEGEIYHPNYLDQPFIQTPGPNPNPTLNFEEGEVIYENTRLVEWSKFWIYSGLAGYLFGAIFVPYQLIFKTHLALPMGYDNLFVPTYTHSIFTVDNHGLMFPIAGLLSMYSAYMGLALTNQILRDYVIRMQYNRDRELIFVTRITPWGSTEEEVFETAHLEILPPAVRTGLQHLSANHDDGLLDVTCMSTQKSLVLYNEDKYWNPSLRAEFLDKVYNLWKPDLYDNSYLRRIETLQATNDLALGTQEHESIEQKRQ